MRFLSVMCKQAVRSDGQKDKNSEMILFLNRKLPSLVVLIVVVALSLGI